MPSSITFVVPGVEAGGETRGARAAVSPVHPSIGRLKTSVTVTTQRGAGDSNVEVKADLDKDFVVLDIAGGPSLWLHPETAQELLQSQHDPLLARGRATTTGEVVVPARLRWRLEEAAPAAGATRGSFLGDVGLQAFHIVTGIAEDKAADFAAEKIVEIVDSQVVPGVYQLQPDKLGPLKDPDDIAGGDAASLVLIHGTFSSTSGTFAKLWSEHPQLVARLFKQFSNRVYALDHATLGASPIANAITLAKAAPQNARLCLLTHSRGGLVAEVLARVCANPQLTDLDRFDGDPKGAGELRDLAKIVSDKRISIERVVRVACPARGTLLASKRLDAYVSVLKWALDLAQIPVAPQLVEFLGKIAQRRADPDEVPGLAAQIPNSPLVQWLHTAKQPIKGDLRVVAGDLQGDSVVSWVKTLLSDAFFWTDNDLVVQTSSMYGGSPRENSSTFVLDQGGRVSHFNYFSNTQTASAIVNAVTAKKGTSPDGFSVIGPLSWAGKDSTGVRAALPTRSAAKAAELPAVFILPGILGSNLKIGDDRIWLGWRLVNGFERLAYSAKNVAPDGPIGIYYDDLATALFQDHDVRQFGFDWRRPIEEQALLLAKEVTAALDARKTSGRPVRIVAHSMGGLVARAMQIHAPDVWNRMMKSDGARILMLGTPNGGSWAPMQVLSGDDTFGNLLINVGAPFNGNATRQLIANFPGFMQLQAGLLDKYRLGEEKTWKDLAKADLDAVREQSLWHILPLQLAQLEWGIPPQAVLDKAKAFRTALDKQQEKDLAAFADKLLLVVGKADSTPAGYDTNEDGNLKQDKLGVVYLDAPDRGDGRVLLESAQLPGVATWVANADHGSLPSYKAAFEGYRDLLNSGTTKRLASLAATGAARGRATQVDRPLVRSRPARVSSAQLPPRDELDVLAPAAAPAAAPAPLAAALRITVVNGDLTYVSDPLLMGHYKSLRLSGAEAVMNRNLNGAMSASLQRHHYPTSPESNQVFVNRAVSAENPWQKLPRPEAVVVAGLGPEGELRGSQLVDTVRQAVIAWAQRLTERRPIPAGFRLATTLLGSGGSGITAGQAAQLIAQGVREANERLSDDGTAPPRWPRVEQLTIIELYLDRASEAWNALQTLATSAPALYTISPTIERTTGALRRPPEAGYRGVDYDFLSALIVKKDDGTDELRYVIDSKRARSEIRPQPVQVGLITNLVVTASNNTNTDTQIGHTLFTLLVPADVESFLGSSTETVLELNQGTAAIPWEILESPTSFPGDKPWSIRTKLLRKLQMPVSTIIVNSATADDSILVVGDPQCDRNTYPILLGARREATEVADCLRRAISKSPDNQALAGTRVDSLISGPAPGDPEPDATSVINKGFEKSWRIIHVAGHGEPPLMEKEKIIDPRGVVLSNGCFLGPKEIAALRIKPELVFVNCCHLAVGDPGHLLKTPAQFAAGVAQALIESGVRCVIAAGWAVDDRAASVFATTFYDALLIGERFIDAVAAARKKAHDCGGNTWAAYQCYGDPDWKFNTEVGDAQRPTPSPKDELASIASAPSLILALERITVEGEYQGKSAEAQTARLRYLEATFGQYRNRGDVADAFGKAWSRFECFDEAAAWYERARTAREGTASLASIEQLANAKARAAWIHVAEDPTPSPEAFDQARRDIAEAKKYLDILLELEATPERRSLYASAFKRLAMVEGKAGRKQEEQDALEFIWKYYKEAEKLGNTFYPAMNRIGAQIALARPVDDQDFEAVRESMSAVSPDFWSVVGQTELQMYKAIAHSKLEAEADDLIAEFHEHHSRVKNARMWGSVFDNATFILANYRRRADVPEANAAAKLLGVLEVLADRKKSTVKAAESGDGPTVEAADSEESASKLKGKATKSKSKKATTKKAAKKKLPPKKKG
jgi:pimeloyl-ACP methyl ester carboxylesterase/tetratricopeptide (TPR) repeat protein